MPPYTGNVPLSAQGHPLVPVTPAGQAQEAAADAAVTREAQLAPLIAHLRALKERAMSQVGAYGMRQVLSRAANGGRAALTQMGGAPQAAQAMFLGPLLAYQHSIPVALSYARRLQAALVGQRDPHLTSPGSQPAPGQGNE